MPQPFKRRGRVLRMSPAVIAENPGLGIVIALVASHWSKIEQSLGIAYTYLLAGEEPSAFEFYHELIDLGLRERAFIAAAKSRVSEEMIAEIAEIHAKVRKLAKARNEVIHGTWCSLPTKPQSLFLAKPADVGRQLNKLLVYVRKAARDRTKLEPQRTFPILPDEYIEWHVRDFQNLMKRIVDLDTEIEAFGLRILSASMKRVSEFPE